VWPKNEQFAGRMETEVKRGNPLFGLVL